MILTLIFLAVAFCALAVLLGRGFMQVKDFSTEKLTAKLGETDSFWKEFHDFFVSPLVRVHRENVRPTAYKEMEKLARRFRIIALKVECLLMRLSDYLRGKRTMQSNGTKSTYWEQINNCKTNANGNENNNHSDNNSVDNHA